MKGFNYKIGGIVYFKPYDFILEVSIFPDRVYHRKDLLFFPGSTRFIFF